MVLLQSNEIAKIENEQNEQKSKSMNLNTNFVQEKGMAFNLLGNTKHPVLYNNEIV
jgi:hypothetical protein